MEFVSFQIVVATYLESEHGKKLPVDLRNEQLQGLNLLPYMLPASHMGLPVGVPPAPLLIQLTANVPGTAVGDVLSPQFPATHVGDLESQMKSLVPGFCLAEF